MNDAERHLMTVFAEALDRAPAAKRVAYLDSACADNPALRERVDALLRAHEGAGQFLERGDSLAGQALTADLPKAESSGLQIGPYKLVDLIGEGGMGAVYLAQQTEPVKRVVALKVIKAGMDSRQVLARFEAERQALALMDHPNIARVLDAGVVGVPASAGASEGRLKAGLQQEGRPYFVMELVKGVPITKFCDERRLTPRERLELFIPVCHAIQHAHQKGIIHRDIKPTNVLVALYDGKPVPKVIDFGVAKATGVPLTEKTLVTGLGALVGTPEYMSPEQAELNQLDVDTRSDIYSLGVLLYELLTGTTPLTRKRLEEGSLLEVLRVIREEEPQKPSTRLSTTHELPSIAANRNTEPARLSRVVRGELDWVAMKALEKERNRRYETASGLAMDVQRYLTGEAVLAVPPSVGYRFRKFARRNKRAFVSTALLCGMLLVLVGGLGWVASDHAARRARTAVEVNQFLQRAESLYANNQLPEAMAEVQKARSVLGSGGDEELHRRVQQWFTDLDTAVKLEEIRPEFTETEARDRLYADYARVFREYGIDAEALSTSEAADRIAASQIKLDLVLALDRWAWSLRYDPRRLEAVRWQRLMAVSHAADPDPWRLRYNAASEAMNLPALRELAAEADPSRMRIRTLAGLGDCLRIAGDVEAATAFLRKVQQQHPGDFAINFSLAYCLRSLNPPRWDEAIAFRRVAVALRPQSYPAQNFLGFALHCQGKLDEALVFYQKAIEIDPKQGKAHFNAGLILRDQGKPREALVYFRKASDLAPNDDWLQYGLAWELVMSADPKLRDPVRAVALAKRAVELKPNERKYWNTLGMALYRAGDLKEARAALQKSLDLVQGGDNQYVCRDRLYLAMANWRLDEKDEARKEYDRATEWILKKAPKDEESQRLRAEAAALMGIDTKE